MLPPVMPQQQQPAVVVEPPPPLIPVTVRNNLTLFDLNLSIFVMKSMSYLNNLIKCHEIIGQVGFEEVGRTFIIYTTDCLLQFSGTKAKTCTNRENVPSNLLLYELIGF